MTRQSMPQQSVKEIAHVQAQADALFFSIGEGAIATDAEGKITRVNQVALDILGYDESELMNKWFPAVVVAQSEEGINIRLIDRPVSQALLSGKPVSEKTYYSTKNGNSIPVFVTVAPIMLDDRPVGAVEVFRDITHEQEIDKMKSEFISIASHQLRTPLTAIKTYSHLLANGYRGELSQGQHEFMDIIMGSIDRMNELINTLLDISRIEEGRIGINAQLTPVNDLINEMITEMRSMADAKHIKLNYIHSDEEFVLNTDPLLLKEVIANLVSNAIKYTPNRGKVTVELICRRNEIIFNVHDTGLGIPKNQQKRVFTKFFRADNVARLDTMGTGLGLYLVGRITTTLGGKVQFRSMEGKGTTFTVRLPK